ncbi:hypothetical protein KUCAC02_006124 [Chaenocephalus aceratus]|uniref:Uncharacterized protein n=1 Tax=Chaenocephalus aceratus TaxID=36190 RepID=A0ACB9WRH0_CHAAC|nr:hypothetical protein KUCAC02_006124 [Chaenocephalus aceratus]
MLVSYFDQELKDVVVEHLGSLEVVKVNAASLEELICTSLRERYSLVKPEPFENYLEQLFTDLHTDHLWESDQIMYLKEIAEYMDIPASNPKRFVSHRRLSAYDVGMQTKRLLPT